jgi:hypothetical protein
VVPGGLDGGLGDGGGEVAAARGRDAVDGGAEAGPVQGVVRAQFARDAEAGGGVRDAPVEAGQVAGELDEAAADVDAVQGAVEEGAQFVLEGEEGAGLGEGGAVGAVGEPFGLFGEAGAEEVPEVVAEGVRAGEPGLVAAGAVGVEAEQEVPGDVGVVARGWRAGEEAFGEAEGGGAADGFVGVRAGDDEGVAGAVADGEQPEGGTGAGGAGVAEAGGAGVAGGEGGGVGGEGVDGGVAAERGQGAPPRGDSVGCTCCAAGLYIQSLPVPASTGPHPTVFSPPPPLPVPSPGAPPPDPRKRSRPRGGAAY